MPRREKNGDAFSRSSTIKREFYLLFHAKFAAAIFLEAREDAPKLQIQIIHKGDADKLGSCIFCGVWVKKTRSSPPTEHLFPLVGNPDENYGNNPYNMVYCCAKCNNEGKKRKHESPEIDEYRRIIKTKMVSDNAMHEIINKNFSALAPQIKTLLDDAAIEYQKKAGTYDEVFTVPELLKKIKEKDPKFKASENRKKKNKTELLAVWATLKDK